LKQLVLFFLCACNAGYPERPSAQAIFDRTAPSVVAITNDDQADREEEARELEKSLGEEAKAPRHVIDVSLRKDLPDGTGFVIAGGNVVTAAHVVEKPDRLKVTTRAGKTVDATLLAIDEVRDLALLQPKIALSDVPPIALEEADVRVGEPLWAMGHTGRGFWALSWGMSEGIASGVIELDGARLVLFDVATYPGFSGGPVVSFRDGTPRVAGVNHAIFYTTALGTPVFSGVAASELRDFVAHKPTEMEKRVAEFAKAQRAKTSAQLFITDKLSVQRAPSGEQIAYLQGDTRSLDVRAEAKIPCVAMLFNLPPGSATLTFAIKSPKGQVLASQLVGTTVAEDERVHFASALIDFTATEEGKHTLEVSLAGKPIGRATLTLEVQGADEAIHDHEANAASDEGDPDVDMVVAQAAEEEPLALSGIRSTWVEKRLPKRVDYTFFARGSRGWSGNYVLIVAYLVDEDGHVAGKSWGCFQRIEPAHTWTCKGDTGKTPPLVMKPGKYDIVLTLNGKPVSWWPMNAKEKKGAPTMADMERWLDEIRKGPKR